MPDAGLTDGVTEYDAAFHDTYVRQQVVAQVTSSTRPTNIEGRLIYETDTDRLLMGTGSGSNWIVMGEPSQTYDTFTLTGVTIGNGTKTGAYRRGDGWCDFWVQVLFGSTTAVTGEIVITLPFAAATGGIISTQFATSFLESGVNETRGHAAVTSTSTIACRAINSAGTYLAQATCSSTVPFTWGTADVIYLSGRYPMTTRYS